VGGLRLRIAYNTFYDMRQNELLCLMLILRREVYKGRVAGTALNDKSSRPYNSLAGG